MTRPLYSSVFPRPVGILGGMGPAATILLQQKLLAAVPARDDADHVPLIIDMNPQVPSRIAHLIEGHGPDPAPVLATMARRLQAAGAQALAMPCNTAHHYAPTIAGAVDIPFLDMIALSAARAAQSTAPGAQVGLLASPAVRRTGLFEAALARHGLRALWPGDDANDQGGLLDAIRLIKAEGTTDHAHALLGAASRDLARRGAGLQLIACTELSLIADSVAPDATSLDTLDVLVDAITDFSLSPAASPAPAGPAQ